MPPLLSSHMLCLMSSAVPNRPSGVRMPHSVRSAVLAQLSNSGRPSHIMTQNEKADACILCIKPRAVSDCSMACACLKEHGMQRVYRDQGTASLHAPLSSYSRKASCRAWHQCWGHVSESSIQAIVP